MHAQARQASKKEETKRVTAGREQQRSEQAREREGMSGQQRRSSHAGAFPSTRFGPMHAHAVAARMLAIGWRAVPLPSALCSHVTCAAASKALTSL